MLPSLKSTYESEIQKKLEECRKNPELIREAIDQRTIDGMEKSLNALNSILKAPELQSLSSFQLGLQKAHADLADILGYGDIRKWAHSLLPKGFTAMGRIAAFTSGLQRLFKQLPTIINIVKGSMGDGREWDENVPMDKLLDSDATTRAIKIIKQSMTPPNGLTFLSTGLPYVKDEEAAAEVLGLTYRQLLSFNETSQQAKVAIPVSPKELGSDIKTVVQGQQTEPAPEAQPKTQKPIDQGSGERLVIPGPTKGQAPVSPAQPAASVPTAASLGSDISDVWDEAIFNMLGERGLKHKMLSEFKPKFIRSLLNLMLKKNYIRKTQRPKE